MKIQKGKTQYLMSVSQIEQLREVFPQLMLYKTGVVFCGRSNVGKSSCINSLFGKKTAKTSKTPGRTQAVNLFHFFIENQAEPNILIDLPGYGHAEVSKAMGKNWQILIAELFEVICTKFLFLNIQDSRHPMGDKDVQFLKFIHHYHPPALFLILNKIDKLTSQKEKNSLAQFEIVNKKELKRISQIYRVSAEKELGFDALELGICSFLLRAGFSN